MILTVNIGNTHITVGGYEQDTLRFCGRLHSDTAATVDEYAIRLVNLLSLHGASPAQIEGGILGSVVPVLSGRVLSALRILCNARILTVGPGLKSGIKLRLDNPAQLGGVVQPKLDAAFQAGADRQDARIAEDTQSGKNPAAQHGHYTAQNTAFNLCRRSTVQREQIHQADGVFIHRCSGIRVQPSTKTQSILLVAAHGDVGVANVDGEYHKQSPPLQRNIMYI